MEYYYNTTATSWVLKGLFSIQTNLQAALVRQDNGAETGFQFIHPSSTPLALISVRGELEPSPVDLGGVKHSLILLHLDDALKKKMAY